MPIATDPKATFNYVLDSDREKPEKGQPTFILKVLSASKTREAIQMNERLTGTESEVAQFDLIFDVIMLGVIGWRNMSMGNGQLTFDRENLLAVLTLAEATELMQAIVHQEIALEDKKKLEPQSQSGTERAITNAVLATSNAKESPTPPNE